jgi:CLIP-associating protein 1/2
VLYQIASAKDLDSEIQAMLPHFQGKETEHNWQSREKSIFKLRGLVQGNAATPEYRVEFVGALKLMQEGILKAVGLIN